MEQIDRLTMDILSYKSKCDDLERELEKFHNQMNQSELNSSSQLNSVSSKLNESERHINELKNEVRLLFKRIEYKRKQTILLCDLKERLFETVYSAIGR